MTGSIQIMIGTEMIPFGSTEEATAYLMKLNKAPKNQKLFIRTQIMKYGNVTRNFALSHYITRLGAIIADLKASGLEIEGSFGENGVDYIYTLKEARLFA